MTSFSTTYRLFDGDETVVMIAEKAAENAGLAHNTQHVDEKHTSSIDKVDESTRSEERA